MADRIVPISHTRMVRDGRVGSSVSAATARTSGYADDVDVSKARIRISKMSEWYMSGLAMMFLSEMNIFIRSSVSGSYRGSCWCTVYTSSRIYAGISEPARTTRRDATRHDPPLWPARPSTRAAWPRVPTAHRPSTGCDRTPGDCRARGRPSRSSHRGHGGPRSPAPAGCERVVVIAWHSGGHPLPPRPSLLTTYSTMSFSFSTLDMAGGCGGPRRDPSLLLDIRLATRPSHPRQPAHPPSVWYPRSPAPMAYHAQH